MNHCRCMTIKLSLACLSMVLLWPYLPQVYALAPRSAFEAPRHPVNDAQALAQSFSHRWLVTQGKAGLKNYVWFDPKSYSQIPLEQLRLEIGRAVLEFQIQGRQEFAVVDPYSVVIHRSGREIYVYWHQTPGGIYSAILAPGRWAMPVQLASPEEYLSAALAMREDSVRSRRHFEPIEGYGPRDNPLILLAEKAKNIGGRMRGLKDADAAKRVSCLLGLEEETGYTGIWNSVLEMLRSDPDTRVRRLAASSLAKGMLQTADPALAEILRPGLPQDMAYWWTRLLAWRGGACCFALASLLVSDNNTAREQALKTLLEYPDPGYLLALYKEIVRNPGNMSGKEFQGAIAALGYLGHQRTIPLIEARLMENDLDLGYRQAAAKALFQICRKINNPAELFLAENKLHSTAINPTHSVLHRVDALFLWESLLTDKISHQLLGAPRRAKQVGEMMPLLADSEPDVCRAAEQVLTHLTDSSIAALIQEKMRDANAAIRAANIRISVKIWTSPGTIILLLDALQDKQEAVQESAVRALGEILYAYLNETDETGRLSAGIGRIAATPFLPKKMLMLRRRAVDFLGLSGNPWAFRQLTQLRDFPELRREVDDALELWNISASAEARRNKEKDRIAQRYGLPADFSL